MGAVFNELGAVFLVVSVISGIWSGVIYQTVYNEVVDTLPPQFQDPHTSRYAFPTFALSHSVPLPIQANYMMSLNGFCVMTFSASLSLFSFHQPIFGGLLLASTVVDVFSTIKSWKTYRENCHRKMAQDSSENK